MRDTNEKIRIGKKLTKIHINRIYNLAYISGNLGRAHISSMDLYKAQKDNRDADDAMIERFASDIDVTTKTYEKPSAYQT